MSGEVGNSGIQITQSQITQSSNDHLLPIVIFVVYHLCYNCTHSVIGMKV